jgi:hypothetical protein
MNNLNRPRPELWSQGSLFPFIEDCWSNSVAVVGNKKVIARRLTTIDAIFEEIHQNLKPSSMAQLVPSFLLLRSFSAFRASVMVCLALPTDSYPLQRSCLENAGYETERPSGELIPGSQLSNRASRRVMVASGRSGQAFNARASTHIQSTSL